MRLLGCGRPLRRHMWTMRKAFWTSFGTPYGKSVQVEVRTASHADHEGSMPQAVCVVACRFSIC